VINSVKEKFREALRIGYYSPFKRLTKTVMVTYLHGLTVALLHIIFIPGDGLANPLSASLLVTGIVMYIFRPVVKFGKTPIKSLSSMSCEAVGHFRFSVQWLILNVL